MKSVYIFLISLIFISPCFLYSQKETDSTKTIKFSERIPAELQLEVKVKYVGAIGYADCFRGNVLKVNKGVLTDTSIMITIAAGDTVNLNLLSGIMENEVLILSLVFNKSNEKYPTTYVTGFVDSNKNSWRIIHIRKKQF
ncbi:MAG: hypothetical protein WC358_08120 [Ignavibacteria bacterium]|jgi:hypothetical protein